MTHIYSQQSGAPIPVGEMAKGQSIYDDLVSKVGCAQSPDSLQCLRDVPYNKLKKAGNDLPGHYIPRVDGAFLIENPFESVRNGRIARVPYVAGEHIGYFSISLGVENDLF